MRSPISAPRPFDTTALVYFEAAARLGSLTAAASELKIAASALSRKIRQLEEEIGAPLFERVPRGLQLTSAGEIMLHHAKQGFQEFRRAREVIEDIRGMRRGKVSVATVETVARGLVVPTLSAFWKSHPGIVAEVDVVSSSEVMKKLRQGDCDLGIAFFSGRNVSGLEVMCHADLHIGAVMAADHELAGAESLSLRDLAPFPVLVAEPTMLLNHLLQGAVNFEVIRPRMRLSSNSTTLLSEIAATGAGIAFKTRLGLQNELRRGELVFVPLSEARLPTQRVALWARRPQQLTRSAQALAGLLGAAIEELNASEGTAARTASGV